MMRGVGIVLGIALALGACSIRQHLITGEPIVLSLDTRSGALLDRDVLPVGPTAVAAAAGVPPTVPHKGEIIAIVVNNVFLRCLEALRSPHVLVYAEVFDDGQDDPATALTKVLFNEMDQPSGVNLGLADRVLYGPTPYKGFPIRIRFNIVELDKDDKKTASRLINAAGSIASGLQPQAAPAVGVAVQVAQLINELNKDDFELRFDFTLHPVATVGTSDIGDTNLTTRGNNPAEPVQRHGRSFSVVSPLRTGSYAIVKRELEDRPQRKACKDPSWIVFDWTQEAFISRYAGVDGKPVIAQELLRLQGGYLYRVVRTITVDGKAVDSATVRLRRGPNATLDFGLSPGIRQRFDDQTYVVLSLLNGLPMGLDQQALGAGARRDAELIGRLLDNPSQTPLAERIGPRVDEVAAAVKTVLEQRRIAEAAARRVGREPAFRTSVDYPLFWTGHIEHPTGAADSIGVRNAIARNSAVLETLVDIIVNLPPMSAGDANQMGSLRDLGANHVEPVPGRPGLFRLNAEGIKKLRAAPASRTQ